MRPANGTETYGIPVEVAENKVTPIQAKPIDLPPPALEPLNSGKEKKNRCVFEDTTGSVHKHGG